MAELPSEMTANQFVETFDDIYESTPSIPQSAYPSLTAGHDTPTSLHKHFSKFFNALSESQRLTILKAHPRLADKTFTKASSEEQASRGLDRLTDGVKARFDDLNNRYEARFGWPFIIPVKDYSVSEILDDMQLRLERERDAEFEHACRCVDRIAQIRLIAWFQENHPDIT